MDSKPQALEPPSITPEMFSPKSCNTCSAVVPLGFLESNTKESLEKIEKSTAQVNDLSTIQNLRDLLKDIEMYKEKNINIFELEKEPFVLSIAQGRLKKLIIVVFAAFFLLVFLAFARNAVLNIKADPEASKIISDAWNSGK